MRQIVYISTLAHDLGYSYSLLLAVGSNWTAAGGQIKMAHDEYLEDAEVNQLKQILESQLEEILSQSRDAMNSLTEDRPINPDVLDVAVNESNRAFDIRLAERELLLAKKIRTSLERIGEGEYSVCTGCGGEIGFKRLLARPVASQCIDCKTETEHRAGRKVF